MDHSEAITLKAAERYALGDLSVSEVEEFERHFFDCPQCSEELRLLSVLQENARAVFIEQSPGPRSERAEEREGWWRRFVAAWRQPRAFVPALAAIVLAIFAGYETGRLRQPEGLQPVSAYPLYAASRGEETVITPPHGAQFYMLYMDRTWDTDFAKYKAVVREDPSGTERYALPIPAPAPGRAIHLLIPIQALRPGRYILTVSGLADSGGDVAVARYPFSLRFE